MKKHTFKTYFALMLAIVMTAGMLISDTAKLFAATTAESSAGDAELTLTANFMLPEDVTQPAADFEFSYTKDGIVTGASAYNSTVTSDSTQPDLTVLDGDDDISFTSGATLTGTDSGSDVYTGTIENILPGGSSFSHAGEYVYTITEDASTNTEIDDDMTYSQAEYKVHVFVKNTSEGLMVSGASVYQTKDDDGNTGSNAKVDLDDNSVVSGTGNDFAFKNAYQTVDENLSITKSVQGDYADLTKGFELSVTLTNPVNIDTESYKAVIVNTADSKPVDTTEYSFVPGTAKSVTLKNNQSLVFVAEGTNISTSTALTSTDTDCMPAGLTYSLEEAAATDYSPKATVTHGGSTDGQIVGNAGETFTVNTNTVVDTGNNVTALESEFHTVAVTGLIIRLLPAILLIALSIIVMIINMNGNRKRNAEE